MQFSNKTGLRSLNVLQQNNQASCWLPSKKKNKSELLDFDSFSRKSTKPKSTFKMPEMHRTEKLVIQDNPPYILHLHMLKTTQVISVVMKLQFYRENSKWELPRLLLQIKVLFKK